MSDLPSTTRRIASFSTISDILPYLILINANELTPLLRNIDSPVLRYPISPILLLPTEILPQFLFFPPRTLYLSVGRESRAHMILRARQENPDMPRDSGV